MKDYYKILGINPTASQEEIKKTYRKLSKSYHPDMGGNENKFKEISEAYDMLGNENKRKGYDNKRNNPFHQHHQGNSPFGGESDFDNIFNSFFNQSRDNRPHPAAGRDLNLKVEVSLEDIYFSREKKIKYSRRKKCFSCNGTGGEWNRCGHCKGSGRLQMVTGNSFFRNIQTTVCPSCNGKGKTPIHLCDPCIGEGVQTQDQVFKFKLPKDIRPGQRMTYPGFGDESPHGNQGNLFVEIKLNDNSLFKVEGKDLIYRAIITSIDLLLGTEITVPHFDGPAKINIPALGDINQTYMLRGKGMKEIGDWNGNLLVKLKIVNPKELTQEQISILAKVQNEENFKKLKK